MQTVAPQIMQHVAPRTVYPHLYQMRPGMLFRRINDEHRVLALLSNDQIDVSDQANIWCVVVAAGPISATPPGGLLPLPRNEPVQVLRVEQPLQLSAVA